MAEFIISSEELRQKKETLAGYARKLDGQIGSLEELGKSLNSMWEGDAKDSFTKSVSMDIGKIRILVKLLFEFLTVLEKIIELYKAMEARNIATAGS